MFVCEKLAVLAITISNVIKLEILVEKTNALHHSEGKVCMV